MPEVNLKKGETIDKALKRLKFKIDSESILEECRRRKAFETPTQQRRRKARVAGKKRIQFRYLLEQKKMDSES